MSELDTRYRELLARQLAMNQETWNTLVGHGHSPDKEIRLDFVFQAPSRTAAESLASLLSDQTDYEFTVHYDGDAHGERWSVSGSTQPDTVDLEILNQWVDWMVSAGLEHDCDFDGWGAEV